MTVGDTIRTGLRGLGQLLITSGIVILLFVVYELFVTNLYTNREQHHLSVQLHEIWTQRHAEAPLILGDGIAELFIPRFERDYDKIIVEGVLEEDLKKGPGHYPGTALPGQIGNFVVSGHRTTYGAPFNRLDELRVGDPIVVETYTSYYVYQVLSEQTVLPDDLAVIAPVPNHPGERPTEAMMTFTTCTPKYSASHRLILYARLASSQPRLEGPPAVLALGG
ncbi:MAG TPA: class E sortase [Mycobacteriales bacterium]|nr:class E sortase [Mycobacteriales bacterium]